MHLVVLVEEPSVEVVLQTLLPTILGPERSFDVIVHQGKADLLAKLPGKLTGYRAWIPDDWRIAVLVDEDREDCRKLKARLERVAREVGFRTQSARAAGGGSFKVLNRLAIEELEAWFFGDVPALRAAFPRIPDSLASKAQYRDPDAIAGGTWETLERVLQRAGYYPAGLAKIDAARSIARWMIPARNRSRSFQVFVEGLREVLAL